jgi:hypothetical protein
MAVASPYYPHDSTSDTSVAHVEVAGGCGTNGLEVLTFTVQQGASTLSVTPRDESFTFAVP